jgi:Domain of unknown function (DUF4062)
MGHIPVGMEMFNAADDEQWQVITRTIDQCDYYVVVVAHRYGSTTADGISFTEKEYDYAREQGIPTLGFVISDDAPWPNDRTEAEQINRAKLDRFKTKVKGKMVRFWSNGTELQAQFVTSLSTTINVKPSRGWVRAPEHGADIAQTLSNLAEENARLRQELDEVRAARLIRDELEDAIGALGRKGINPTDFVFYAEHGTEYDVAMSDAMEILVNMGLFNRYLGGTRCSLTALGSRVYTRMLVDAPPF